EPYVEAAVVPTVYLASATPLSEAPDLLADVISGDAIVVAAFDPDQRDGSVVCTLSENDARFCGRIKHVPGAAAASSLLVPAVDQQGQQVIALVDCSLSGVRRETLPTIDGGSASFVTFDRVTVPRASVWPCDARSSAAFALAVDTGIV